MLSPEHCDVFHIPYRRVLRRHCVPDGAVRLFLRPLSGEAPFLVFPPRDLRIYRDSLFGIVFRWRKLDAHIEIGAHDVLVAGLSVVQRNAVAFQGQVAFGRYKTRLHRCQCQFLSIADVSFRFVSLHLL